MFNSLQCQLVFSCCLENAQDVDKEVDEVKVEVYRSQDVLLW